VRISLVLAVEPFVEFISLTNISLAFKVEKLRFSGKKIHQCTGVHWWAPTPVHWWAFNIFDKNQI